MWAGPNLNNWLKSYHTRLTATGTNFCSAIFITWLAVMFIATAPCQLASVKPVLVRPVSKNFICTHVLWRQILSNWCIIIATSPLYQLPQLSVKWVVIEWSKPRRVVHNTMRLNIMFIPLCSHSKKGLLCPTTLYWPTVPKIWPNIRRDQNSPGAEIICVLFAVELHL